MKACVTISLVQEAKGGPFVFWDDLPRAIRKGKELGYAAVEIFAPDVETLVHSNLQKLVAESNLELAAFGTGAGWVKHKLTLSSPDAAVRERGRAFIRGFIDLAKLYSASVIIGSMQGRFEGSVTREQALKWLAESLTGLGQYAAKAGVGILYEPLNRYETNLLNRLEDVVPFVRSLQSTNIKILADLFHMNMEEANVADALRQAGGWVGHIHFVDSNRRPAGLGHTDFAPIFKALKEIGYNGYISAEAFPYPDSDAAAAQTIKAFRKYAK
jgi:sugar phosphate isomerase/epimerase